MVMINDYCKLCASLYENLMGEFYETEQKWNFKAVFNCYVEMETTKTSNFTRQSKSFIKTFFTCKVSACELQAFSCHYLANDIP